MNKYLLVFILSGFFGSSFAQDCNSPGLAQIDLDANNIRARLLNSGDFWWDGANGRYIAPVADPGFPEVSAIFAGALWIGGVSPLGEIKLAAQQYRNGNETDFYPGPLKFGDSAPGINECNDWDRFWKVKKSDVESHISDYEDNGIIDDPIISIMSWPGRNNSSFSDYFNFDQPVDHDMAPFFDVDQDGNYNPENGDYPLIKGDQSIWWVFNDLAGPHRVTAAEPMGIEVQAMAYAEASEDVSINNATYYDFKITNQSGSPLMNSYMGLWVDFDLGCYEDDYIGYNEEHQMMFAYNQDAVDGNPGSSCPGGVETYGEDIPIIGISQFGNSEFPATSFVVFDGITSVTSLPNNDFEYYNNLQGKWRDGWPMTIGGNGFDPSSSDTTTFLLTGDPSDDTSWNMCSANLPEADRRCLMSTGMNTLQPGQSFTNSYAVIFVENESYPCPSLDRLIDATEIVVNNVTTSTYNIEDISTLEIFPNPAKNVVHIKSEKEVQKIQLLSTSGQVMKQEVVANFTKGYAFNLSEIPNGMYIISVIDKNGNSQLEKIIVQN